MHERSTEIALNIVVSVVTPTFNRVGLLRKTVSSILDQTVAGLEYIIVDDGSTDGTAAYLEALPTSIKIIRQANGGQVRALLEGWREAQGRYLTYLSDDDLLVPNALAKLTAHLDAHPQTVAVFPNADLVDLDARVVQHSVCRPFSLEELAVKQQCFIGPGAVFRRSVYQDIGGWDSVCRLLPDLEFWTRVGSVGTIDFLQDVLALYRIHPGSLSVPANRSETMAREYSYVVNKFFDGPYCPEELRGQKARALANTSLIVARNHLRNMDFSQLAKSIATAYRQDPASLNIRSIASLAASVVPLSIKQGIRRATQAGRRKQT